MTVKITVESIFQNQAFEQARRESGQLNAALKSQFDERRKIIELQGRLAGAASREERAAIRANIGEIRRKLSLEQLNTRELKEQISQQRRLNQLTEKLNRDLEKQRHERSLTGRLQAGGRALGIGGAGGVALGIAGAGIAAREAFEFGKENVRLAREQLQVEAQLEARIRSTGGAAGFTAGELKKMAGELQSTTNIGDDATIAAQAMLLSFTNIRENLPRTTEAVLDVATAMNNGATPSAEQLKNTAVQLGKALNDPEKGLSALTRVGVTFTEQQKEQIKALVKSGQAAKAQAIILAELEKEFGGSAEAARDADGGFQGVANAFGDIREQLGFLVLDLNTASGAGEGFAKTLDGLAADFRDVRVDLGFGSLDEQIATTEERIKELQKLGSAEGFDAFTQMFLTSTAALDEWQKSGFDAAAAAKKLQDELKTLEERRREEEAATKDGTDTTEENTEVNEEEAKRLEKVAQIRRDFAGKLLDIDEDTQEKINDSWDDYYQDVDEAATASAKRLADLEKDAAKERAEIQKKLGKDLAKLDRDLARDKEKIGADAEKKIKRLQQDAARENSGDERKRRIDALGDERLFQFELRQLAADGEALRIQEAIERRKIEQEIGEQKRGEEGRAESDDLDLKIQRIREDAQDQVREEEAQARERRALLKEQAEEDRAQLEEQLTEEKEIETEALQARLDKLKETNRGRLADIEQSKVESIKKLGEELAQTKDLTVSELEALKPVAAKMGQDVGDAFAEGITRGAERLRDVADMLGEIDERAQKIIGAASLSSPTTFGFAPGRGGSKGRKRPKRFQHGGEFMVGGSGGPDSELVQFMATPGENVKVTPPGAGGGASISFSPTIKIEIAGNADRETAEQIARDVDAKLQNFVKDLEHMIGT